MHGDIFKTCLQINSLDYIWEKKNVKNINLRITNKQEIYVSSHYDVSQEKIESFMQSKYEWIVKRLKQLDQMNKIRLISDKEIMLFGRMLTIKLTKGKMNAFRYTKNYLYVTLIDENEYETLLKQYLYQLCVDLFKDVVSIVHEKMYMYHEEFPHVIIKPLKNCWGKCCPNNNTITLNSDLIHYPIDFVEYVVLHEFAHFVYMNHSKEFYDLIKKHMPDYQKRIEHMKSLDAEHI